MRIVVNLVVGGIQGKLDRIRLLQVLQGNPVAGSILPFHQDLPPTSCHFTPLYAINVDLGPL